MAEHSAIHQILDLIGKGRNISDIEGHLVKRVNSPVREVGQGKKILSFNISGQKFLVSQDLFRKYPSSKLASLDKLEAYWAEDLDAFFLDRDPALFNAVLNIFKYDYIHIPRDSNETLLRKELKFWEIDVDELYFVLDEEEARLEEEFVWMECKIPPPDINTASIWSILRYKMWCFLTDPLGSNTPFCKLAVLNAVFTIAMTVSFMVIFGLSTKRDFRQEPYSEMQDENLTGSYSINSSENYVSATSPSATRPMKKLKHPECEVKIECFVNSRPVDWIHYTLMALGCFLVVDTALRIICCPHLKTYLKSVVNLCDILATLCLLAAIPFVFDELRPMNPSRVYASISIAFQAMQVLRLSKIFQYAMLLDGLLVMMLTVRASLKELLVLLTYILMAMIFFSTLVTFLELYITTGTGIPDAIIGYWWAIITMTTVGYGDYYPESSGGLVIGTFCAITGLIMTALPVAVIGSNFNVYWEHNKKRKLRNYTLTAVKSRYSRGISNKITPGPALHGKIVP